MGKVAMYPKQELRQLQEMKQTARKEFDKNLDNEQRLEHIKKLRHNYERSQEMFASIKKIGFTDSVEDINNIISHLLLVSESVSFETRVDHPSELEGPSYQIKVLSTWVILPDNTKYLSTIKFIPKQGG